MKTIVIYKSKTGFVKKYAELLAEDLSADIFEVSKIKSDELSKYDTVIYGGSLHAVGIIGIKFIKKNIDKIKGKKIIVFASGASPSSEKVINDVVTQNFTIEQQKYIKFFYLRGGFDYNKLPFIDKVLMTLLKWHIKFKKKRKKELSFDEIGMLELFDKPTDFTNKIYLNEIISYVKSQ
ncbi:MAG TPA: flavodoxin [Acholeplasmataceae bacterium]|nr:flavodoxin [Acholeplasmataceae bacterium]